MSQRWHEWRNVHSTPCPSHGCVRVVTPVPVFGQVPGGGTVDPDANLTENEMLGSNLILHGTRPNYVFANDNEYNNAGFRGLSIHMAFNGDMPVEPGKTGLLTFDLPTWAVVDDMPGGATGLVSDSVVVTVFNDWVLHYHGINPNDPLKIHTGVLPVFGCDPVNNRVFVGHAIVYGLDIEVL